MASDITPQELEYQKLHYYDDKAPAVIAGSIILIVFATVNVVLRLLARRMSAASWKADDYSIIVALVMGPVRI